MRLGFGAALVMPPYFFRGVTDDGVMLFFERLIEGAQPPKGTILLYNFPAMSGVMFHPDLVDRLMERFPGIIGGIKDSSNDAGLQRELAARHPDLLVYPSSESFLSDTRERGYAGCISGTVALWPELAARVWSGDRSAQRELTQRREIFARIPIIAGVRYVRTQRAGNLAWQRTLPPLTPLDEAQVTALREQLEQPAARD
jgi:4-hydroxy-tetrahydrodipicolinate synthase